MIHAAIEDTHAAHNAALDPRFGYGWKREVPIDPPNSSNYFQSIPTVGYHLAILSQAADCEHDACLACGQVWLRNHPQPTSEDGKPN